MVNALDELIDEVDNWVKKNLDGYIPRSISSNKVIKDPVWGMPVLTPLEVSLLDSPLLQRLRRIHQTGLVFLTYPAALHTRFDHSIGMLHCATLIINSINRKQKITGKGIRISDEEEQVIRLASLLHDIGHTALSHLTEDLFSNYTLINKAKMELENCKRVIPKNHELLSAVIVKTPSFLSLFNEIIKKNHHPFYIDVEMTIEHIFDMIIGVPINSNYEKAYITEIINGPYDADKLDYIFRDSYFTGISLGTDVEKFIAGLSIEKVEETKRFSIVLDANSISSYDQLLWSKISLYSTVYNHQKVLATNQVVKNILRVLKGDTTIFIKNVDLKNPINFLSLTDWDFLVGITNSPVIEKLQKAIEKREIPVRCVRISRLSIDSENKKLPPEIIERFTKKENQEYLRVNLCNDLGIPESGPETVTIGISKIPVLEELVSAYIKNYDGSIELFNDMSPLNNYYTYSMHKWAGYVFGPYSYSLSKDMYNKICLTLNTIMNIKLNENAKPKNFKKGDVD